MFAENGAHGNDPLPGFGRAQNIEHEAQGSPPAFILEEARRGSSRRMGVLASDWIWNPTPTNSSRHSRVVKGRAPTWMLRDISRLMSSCTPTGRSSGVRLNSWMP